MVAHSAAVLSHTARPPVRSLCACCEGGGMYASLGERADGACGCVGGGGGGAVVDERGAGLGPESLSLRG